MVLADSTRKFSLLKKHRKLSGVRSLRRCFPIAQKKNIGWGKDVEQKVSYPAYFFPHRPGDFTKDINTLVRYQ